MSSLADPEQGGHEKTPLVKAPKNQEADVERKQISIREEILDTIVLGAPIFVSMVSWVGVGLNVCTVTTYARFDADFTVN